MDYKELLEKQCKEMDTFSKDKIYFIFLIMVF